MRTIGARLATLIFLGVIVLALAAIGIAGAGPFEDGVEAYDRGDYATALWLFLPLANQGNADAQNYLGFMYANGRGVSPNDAEAIKWWRRAADQGNADAQLKLAIFFGYAAHNDAEALKWWLKAADRGRVIAQRMLGPNTPTATAWRRTTPRRSGGIARPPTKATLFPKTHWGKCTRRAKGPLRTMQLRRTGIERRWSKGAPMTSLTLEPGMTRGAACGRITPRQ